jgi:hypothetical protein
MVKTHFLTFSLQQAIANFLLLIAYFIFFHYSNWWVALSVKLIGVIGISILGIKFYRRELDLKKLIFLSPAVFIILSLYITESDDFIGALIEYKLRESHFKSDLKLYQEKNSLVTQYQWPAWNENAVNIRYFMYSEKNTPNASLERDENSTCIKTIKKLDSHFYIVSISGCSGPLF